MQTTAAPSAIAPRAAAATYTISVAAPKYGYQYYPPSVTANVGDQITFEFYPSNHSVVRAAYGTPCLPYEDIVPDGKGFYSQPFLVDNFKDTPTWNLTVFTAEPIFFYCTAIGSCIKEGMVGAINPNATQTWAAQQAAAERAAYMLVPGQAPPAEGAGSGEAASSSSPASNGTHLSGGAIAGIVVGCLVALVVLGALFFSLGRNKFYAKRMSEHGGASRTAAWVTAPWSSDKGSTRAPEDGTHPQHMSLMSMPESTWRGGSPPPQGWGGYPGGQYGQGPYPPQFQEAPAMVHEVHEVDGANKKPNAVVEMSADGRR